MEKAFDETKDTLTENYRMKINKKPTKVLVCRIGKVWYE